MSLKVRILSAPALAEFTSVKFTGRGWGEVPSLTEMAWSAAPGLASERMSLEVAPPGTSAPAELPAERMAQV